MKTIKFGDTGDAVKQAQRLLQKAGYYQCLNCKIDGDYGQLTESAVQEFQGGQLGPDRQPLVDDGIVGPNTWWALSNQHGRMQMTGIDPLIPGGLTPQRRIVLDTICDKYREGVHEIPDGSNSGDGVDDITGGWAVPWCALTVHWTFKLALRVEPWGDKWHAASVINIYHTAKQDGTYRSKNDYTPIPGDIFIMLYRDRNGNWTGKGHTGFILCVSSNGRVFITLEGNSGNALACKRRTLDQASLVGFVNPYSPDEQPTVWERGLIEASAASNTYSSTR